MVAKSSAFSSLQSLLSDVQVHKNPYISKEYQDYGYRLAVELNDLPHKSLYIKMAKQIDRGVLEQARSFVIDADSAKSKARLFMWKVQQLKLSKKVTTPKAPVQQALF